MKARKLNKEERELVVTTVARHKRRLPLDDSLRVAYSEMGNFTLATLFVGPEKVLVGSAKRNPTDAVNPLAGRNRALSRALQNTPVTYV